MTSVLEISPLSRVEGHGKVIVYRDGTRVERVTLSLTESPRLFEALLLGKSYGEVAEIVCRICSLCSTVHRVVSLQAIEKALALQVSEQVKLYRELILNGGHIQSHALHLFCLALPDYMGVAGLPGLAAKVPGELKMGLRLKAAGNQLQEIIGGRLIHPVTLIPGGMGKPVARDVLLKLRETLQATLSDAWSSYRLFQAFPSPAGSLGTPRFLSVEPGVAPPLFGEKLTDGTRAAIPVEAYRDLLAERIVEDSNAKSSGPTEQPFTVGALARLNLGLPLASEAMAAFRSAAHEIVGKDIRANNLAQAIELIHAVERSVEIIDLLLERGFVRERPPLVKTRKGTGTAAIEAPRGVLIHSYSFDGRGLCTAADVITPTAINQAAIQLNLAAMAHRLEAADDGELCMALEQLIRAYDPCISCAVHVVDL